MIRAPGTAARTPAHDRRVGCDRPALEVRRRRGHPPSCRRSAPHRRRPRAGRPDRSTDASTRRSIRRWNSVRARAPPAAGPAPGPACPARRSCRSPPSRARRRSRSASSPPAGAARTGATVSNTGASASVDAIDGRAPPMPSSVDRIEPRTLALDEPDLPAERIRHDQDVGEQDRRIEAEAADRLQRHLGGELGIVAEVEERPAFGPRSPDTPADSGRPGASARSAAGSAALAVEHGDERPCGDRGAARRSHASLKIKRIFLLLSSFRGWISRGTASVHKSVPQRRSRRCLRNAIAERE